MSETSHEFEPSHTGYVCDHMVMRDGGGEPCGRSSEDPVHTVKPVLDPRMPFGGYADGTSGHSGTSTSEARVRKDDASGTTAERQEEVLRGLRALEDRGMTVKWLREATGWHHGVASAALTNLHKAGKIARLAEERDRCKVYVLPEHVFGRETEAYASRSPRPEPLTGDERRLLTAALDVYLRSVPPDSHPWALARSAITKIEAGAQ